MSISYIEIHIKYIYLKKYYMNFLRNLNFTSVINSNYLLFQIMKCREETKIANQTLKYEFN